MFNERLRSQRKLLHFTQEYVAKEIGVTRAAYSAYESGKRQPNFLILINIAQLLNVSIDYLLGNNKNDHRNDLGIMAEDLLKKSVDDNYYEFWGQPATPTQKSYLETALRIAIDLAKQKA
ncbi:helix-turn-helix domain-containing protein [Xylocopilactobacillus apicola]|uniref:HTH-type transcriptional regulator YqaE n=1 Tax=Xylocopilactobacillus apicola TaxID=2932184 RepID=A0AAU9DVN9_9LACO|nr:helix-turn-helix transcriptional regulator [Xylocopilactobacillus apicola]BDR57933.1 putative HTH-type transcriptional regulator YqaE [Xylocopilactobacillus apicola]